MLARLWRIAKREARDFFSLWFIPGVAIALPWHVCLRWYRWWASSDWIAREEVSSTRNSDHLGFDFDARFWRNFRFAFLMEAGDTFRACGRGWRALAQTIEGPPIDIKGGGLWFFFYFNQGLPALAHARAEGLSPQFVHQWLDQRPIGCGFWRYWYLLLRLKMVAKVTGNQGIPTGGARPHIVAAMDAGRTIIVAADSPPRAGRGLVEIRFPGNRPAYWRSGIIKLAQSIDRPVASFTVAIDWDTGRRRLDLNRIPSGLDVRQLTDRLNAQFLSALEAQPEQWFYWPGSRAFLVRPEDTRIDA